MFVLGICVLECVLVPAIPMFVHCLLPEVKCKPHTCFGGGFFTDLLLVIGSYMCIHCLTVTPCISHLV